MLAEGTLDLSDEQKKALQARRSKMGVRRKTKRPPRWLFPESSERLYVKKMSEYVAAYSELVNDFFIKELDTLTDLAQRSQRDHINASLKAVVSRLEKKGPNPEVFIREVWQSVTDFNGKQFHHILNEVYGIRIAIPKSVYEKADTVKTDSIFGVNMFLSEPWLKESLDKFLKENITLIKSIPEENLFQIEKIIKAGIQEGIPPERMAKDISQRLEVAKSRGNLIARDQINKLNGQITQKRQENIGVKSYTWITVGDERVRPEHSERNGKIFAWSDAPSGGHPGSEINCRCSASPILDDVLAF